MDRLTYAFSVVFNNLFYGVYNFFSSYFTSIIILAIAFILAHIFKGYFANIIINSMYKLLKRTKLNVEKPSMFFLKKPLHLIFVSTVMFISFISQKTLLVDYPMMFTFIIKIYRLAIILCIIYFIYTAIPIIMGSFSKINNSDSVLIDDTLMMFFTKIIKVVILVIAILIVLGEFGLNVNGLITGVGLGGLTFALAAQDTASNIFGGLVIISDKPFSVGDWIQVSSIEGVVEEISFRSTRIRTFDDALIVVPNATLASASITNWSKMNKRKIKFNLGLTYSTSPSQIRKIIKDIQECIDIHKDIIKDTSLVTLDEFAQSSINIMVMFYTNQTTLFELKRVKQEVNYHIIDILQKNDSNFALPSTSIYMENL